MVAIEEWRRDMILQLIRIGDQLVKLNDRLEELTDGSTNLNVEIGEPKITVKQTDAVISAIRRER